MILNRIGDYMLIIAIVILFQTFQTLDYLKIFSLINNISGQFTLSMNFFFFNYDFNFAFLIGVFILIGAVSKSAQLGLHT
jgi:NADH:ubiquinone oxidoreductase subunit 5 (subunit L)/multisubunit Na+/H+ antiporter MnhA subunit